MSDAPESVDPAADRSDNDRPRGHNNSTRRDSDGTNRRARDAACSVDTRSAVDYGARSRCHQGNEATR
jgi:hypothetical protein